MKPVIILKNFILIPMMIMSNLFLPPVCSAQAGDSPQEKLSDTQDQENIWGLMIPIGPTGSDKDTLINEVNGFTPKQIRDFNFRRRFVLKTAALSIKAMQYVYPAAIKMATLTRDAAQVVNNTFASKIETLTTTPAPFESDQWQNEKINNFTERARQTLINYNNLLWKSNQALISSNEIAISIPARLTLGLSRRDGSLIKIKNRNLNGFFINQILRLNVGFNLSENRAYLELVWDRQGLKEVQNYLFWFGFGSGLGVYFQKNEQGFDSKEQEVVVNYNGVLGNWEAGDNSFAINFQNPVSLSSTQIFTADAILKRLIRFNLPRFGFKASGKCQNEIKDL